MTSVEYAAGLAVWGADGVADAARVRELILEKLA